MSRAAAEREADVLLSRRAERFEQRERELRGLIADFHQATDRAARIRSGAEAKASALRERAQKEASEFDAAAHAAVRAMVEFGESKQSIEELTGLPAAEVRRLAKRGSAPPETWSGA